MEALDDLVIDPALIRKYDRAGPRYTSYPTADRFVEAFDTDAYAQWLGTRPQPRRDALADGPVARPVRF